jgi:hypothetical protein
MGLMAGIARPVFEGPLLIAKLHDAGIEAIGDETFNVATEVRSDDLVRVRRCDLEAAITATG